MSAIRSCTAYTPRNATEHAIDRAIQTLRAVGIGELRAAIHAGLERYRYRRELRRLLRVGPHMIDDVGLDRDQALHEADKPFWRL